METTVTIKYGKGYEETWAVFKGTNDEVRGNLENYFGVDPAATANLTLSELVVNVTSLAHGKGNVAAALGGVVLGSRPSTPAESASVAADEAQTTDAWTAVENGEPAPNPLLAQIETTTSVDALKLLYAENQAAFADEAVMAAWKAKGKALTT